MGSIAAAVAAFANKDSFEDFVYGMANHTVAIPVTEGATEPAFAPALGYQYSEDPITYAMVGLASLLIGSLSQCGKPNGHGHY